MKTKTSKILRNKSNQLKILIQLMTVTQNNLAPHNNELKPSYSFILDFGFLLEILLQT